MMDEAYLKERMSKEHMGRRSFLRAAGLGLAAAVCSGNQLYAAVQEEKPVKPYSTKKPCVLEDDSPYGSPLSAGQR